MSTSYHSFASVYDRFMDNIPYAEWADYLTKLFSSYNIHNDTLVELGCGTASLSLLMADRGYSILGIDNSTDMLTIAAEKISDHPDITLVYQDMTELLLPDKYSGFYSLCDSMNYLLSSDDMLSTFTQVKRYLAFGGVFIFDLKTPYFYREILGDQVFCDHQENCSYTWENSFFEDEQINQYDLHIFIKQKATELYEHYQEVHHQKAYALDEVIHLIEQSGLEYVTSYEAFTEKPPDEYSERIYIIARNNSLDTAEI